MSCLLQAVVKGAGGGGGAHRGGRGGGGGSPMVGDRRSSKTKIHRHTPPMVEVDVGGVSIGRGGALARRLARVGDYRRNATYPVVFSKVTPAHVRLCTLVRTFLKTPADSLGVGWFGIGGGARRGEGHQLGGARPVLGLDGRAERTLAAVLAPARRRVIATRTSCRAARF
jgi:hypothetical protein